jgi:hypothetical protein
MFDILRERSFSRVKLIKTNLRSTTEQERLIHLSIMPIENTVARHNQRFR